MKNIMNIFKTDLRNTITNWAAAIIIGGLIILPSLYAWFNIAAMWDPYSLTGNLPIAIVNEDVGATVRDDEIDVGKELVQELKNNPSMEWHFTDRQEAMEKVEYGDYFAVVIIPPDFSEKLASVISDHPEKAKMEYYVNEKLNSVSPKITEKGASVIAEQISSKFISTVNGVIFDLFNELGIELEGNLPDIKKFEEYIFTLEQDLPEIKRLLNETITDATSAQSVIDKAQGMLPEAKTLTNNGLDTINKTTDFLTETENRLNEMAPRIKEDLEKVQKTTQDINDFLSKVQNSSIDLSKGDDIYNNLQNQLSDSIQTLETIESSLNQLKDINKQQPESPEQENPPANSLNNEQLDNALEKIAALKTNLQQAQEDVTNANQYLKDKEEEIKETIQQLHDLSANASIKIDEFVKEYKKVIEPTVLNEVAKAKETLSGAKGVLVEIQSTLPEVERVLNNTDGKLGEGKEKLEYAQGELPFINEKINALAEKIRNINAETDINEIIQLLQNNPDAERSFFEEPVFLDENKLFPIENYGTGMTPFYTVLAIWVGGLLLISLLSVDVKNPQLFKTKEIYFGRLLTFMVIGFLQTLIVTSGDLVLLGVSAKEPFWMIVFGLFISLVFMIIVYTLVSVFGNVGKAIAIVMLVLQIAGSGGTYPVPLLPTFFQMISPFLPFTYAVDLMREAVGGIVWRRVAVDVTVLAVFGLIFILLGTFFKEVINKKTAILMKKSKESGLLH
ncbi:MAG TPA: YhgE/Pip domain-containing protein [Bacillaceae bacterium]|nr:YhgE/Pip domain-containing protein [Bacillaceae bacterium]